jgi:hypothetical protein
MGESLCHVRVQFSLKTLLLGTVSIGAIAGMVASKYHSWTREHAVIGDIRRLGGTRLMDFSGTVGLFLDGTALDDEQLIDITLAFPKIEKLYISHTAITDRGIVSLVKLRCLRVLWINGNKISDPALETLARISTLSEVCLDDSQVTPAALDRLRSKLPNTSIVVVDHVQRK